MASFQCGDAFIERARAFCKGEIEFERPPVKAKSAADQLLGGTTLKEYSAKQLKPMLQLGQTLTWRRAGGGVGTKVQLMSKVQDVMFWEEQRGTGLERLTQQLLSSAVEVFNGGQEIPVLSENQKSDLVPIYEEWKKRIGEDEKRRRERAIPRQISRSTGHGEAETNAGESFL